MRFNGFIFALTFIPAGPSVTLPVIPFLKQSIRKGFGFTLLSRLFGNLPIQRALGGINVIIEVFLVEKRAFTNLDGYQLTPLYHPVKRRRRDSEITTCLFDGE